MTRVNLTSTDPKDLDRAAEESKEKTDKVDKSKSKSSSRCFGFFNIFKSISSDEGSTTKKSKTKFTTHRSNTKGSLDAEKEEFPLSKKKADLLQDVVHHGVGSVGEGMIRFRAMQAAASELSDADRNYFLTTFLGGTGLMLKVFALNPKLIDGKTTKSLDRVNNYRTALNDLRSGEGRKTFEQLNVGDDIEIGERILQDEERAYPFAMRLHEIAQKYQLGLDDLSTALIAGKLLNSENTGPIRSDFITLFTADAYMSPRAITNIQSLFSAP